MRLKLLVCGVTTILPALLLTGCGVNSATVGVSANVSSPAYHGTAMGGQKPVVGATVYVVAMGSSGYGSQGKILATATTDSGGNFSFPAGAYTCPQGDTPIYLMSLGGNAGYGTNTSIVEAAGLGACSIVPSEYVVMNEVTTIATAFALSHYFTTTLGGTNLSNADGDWFGGPSTPSTPGLVNYSVGMSLANTYTLASIIELDKGLPNSPVTPSASNGNFGYTNDYAKLYSLANALGACINSAQGSTQCNDLFLYTTPPTGGTAPSDTLQAAVQIALNPQGQYASQLYTLSTTTPPPAAFGDTLSAAPNDWSISVSYTTPTLGLGVDTGTISTLDIDATNLVWFPSNLASATGIAYFDPTTIYSNYQSSNFNGFNGPYNFSSPNTQVHPEALAIDANSYAWMGDTQSINVGAYFTYDANPADGASVPFAGPTNTSDTVFTNSVDIAGDGTIVMATNNNNGTYGLGTISNDYSTYSLDTSFSFTLPVSTVTSDIGDNLALATSNPTGAGFSMHGYYVPVDTSSTPYYTWPTDTSLFTTQDFAGQAVWIGTPNGTSDYVYLRSYTGLGGGTVDEICLYSKKTCYELQNGSGGYDTSVKAVAVDGADNLWITQNKNGGVLHIPINSAGAAGGLQYVAGSTSTSKVPNYELLHGASVSTTGAPNTAPSPEGIAIDNAGNVWVTNAGCTTTGCTPGSFTLTEIIGAAAPTITPISGQITSGSDLVGTEPQY